MDKESIILSLATILFGWLFFRTNANHNKSEDVRKEIAEKIKHLYEENKMDRAQHNEDMLKIQKSIHDMTLTISDQIKGLNVMPSSEVKEQIASNKEYVNFKMMPVEKLDKKLDEVVQHVSVLLERSNRQRKGD